MVVLKFQLFQRAKIILALAGLMVLHAPNAYAQATDPIEYQIITEDIIQDFAKMFKVSPDDPQLRAVFDATNAELRNNPLGTVESLRVSARQPNAASQDRSSFSITLARTNVIAHYRVGEGVAFIPAEPEPTSTDWQNTSKSVSKYFLDSLKFSVQQVRQTPPLPDCAKDEVTRSELDSGDPEFDRMREDDFLYIRGNASSELSARIGKNTVVVECSNEKGDSCAVASQFTNIRCLPTRVTMSRGRITRIEGTRALESYKNGVETSRKGEAS